MCFKDLLSYNESCPFMQKNETQIAFTLMIFDKYILERFCFEEIKIVRYKVKPQRAIWKKLSKD